MSGRNTILPIGVLGLGLAVVGVIGAQACPGEDAANKPHVTGEVLLPERPTEDAPQDVTAREAEPSKPWAALQTDGSSFAALVDGQPVPATYSVGAAGHYPPARTVGTSIALPQPAQTMSGDEVDVVEVLVQSLDGEHAFWDEVPTGAVAVDMVAAHDLRVRVVNTAQRPIAGAHVRLGREVVSLLPQRATTDEDGWATFATLPRDGVYVATFRNLTVDVVDEATIVVPPTISVRGTVRGPDGEVVAGATVAVYGAEHGVDPLSDLPADVVTTTAHGTFDVSGVAGAQFAVVASAENFPPAHVVATPTLLDDLVLDVAFQRGRSITARVVDERGNPVAGAAVRWRDPTTGVAGAALCDELGVAQLRNVPPLAELSAEIAGYASGVTQLGNVQGDHVELTLRRADARSWRVRVEMPRDLALLDLAAHDAAGVRCAVDTSDGRDFMLTGCGEHKLLLEVLTAFGTARVEAAAVDGVTVVVPPPTRVDLTLRGVEGEDWGATEARVRPTQSGRVAHAATLEIVAGRAETSLYPGDWTLEVTNRRIGRHTTQLTVGTSPLQHTVQLEAVVRKSFHVVDAYGAPVTGAFALLFSGDQLVDTARSAGQLPTTFSNRAPFVGTILVVDPRRGEGALAWSASADRVELSADVLATPIPRSRVRASELSNLLGSPLSATDRGFIVDVQPGSAAATAGIERGDRVITAWRAAGRVRVLVARGASLVDLRL